MKTLILNGEIRSNTGKVSSKELRSSGQVPCVVYGGTDHIHFSLYAADLRALIYTPNTYLVQLNLGSKVIRACLKDKQFHPVSDAMLHIDFQEIVDGKPVTLNIPVRTHGNAAGVRAGGRISQRIKSLRVHGMADKMPDVIDLDVEKLEIGQGIRVRDIKIDDMVILDAPANTVVAVEVTRASMQAEATPKAEAPKAAAPAAAAPEKKK
jgi:large subunit ribosomal protein L25